MSKKHILIAWILVMVSALPVLATDYPLRHYTVADGLPSNEVYHVFQDSKGFIWICTDNGVTRFDGDEFTIFNQQDGLTDNTVFEAFEDSNGKIWFTGISGLLSVFEDNKIHPYRYNHLLKQLPTNETIIEKSTFYADSTGTISFLSRSHGLKVITGDGELMTYDSCNFAERPSWYIVDFSWRPVVPINCNTYYRDIFLYTEDSLTNHTRIPSNRFLMPPSARHWGDKYIIHGNDLITIADKEGEINRRIFPTTILYLTEPRENQMWVGLQNGGAQLLELPSLKTIISVEGIKDCSVTSVIEDSEGGLWFTTLSSGVFYVNPPESRLSKLMLNMPATSVKSLDYGPDSSVYVGYWKPFFSILSENGIAHQYPDINVQDNLINFYYDNYDSVTYATGSTSLYFFNYNSSPFINCIEADNHVKEYIRVPADSCVHGASVAGIVKIRKDYFQRVVIDNSKRKVRLQCIDYDSINNYFWMGSINGLYYYDRAQKQYHEYISSKTNIWINDLLFHDSTLWIATKGNGLLCLKNGELSEFQIGNSRSHSIIYQILHIDGDIWLNAGLHLIRIQKDGGEWQSYDFPLAHDQIFGNINDIIEFGNKILVGTSNGLYEFDYQRIEKRNKEIPVYITNVSINLKEVDLQKLYSLQHDENNIKFSYTALTFFDPLKQVFYYRLEGLNEEWTPSTNKEVTFHNIPSGKYTFQLKYNSPFDNTYLYADPVFIIIKKPWWKTWWFIIMAIGVPLGLLLLLQSLRLKRIKRDNDFRQELLDARQKALMNQINPHFIFNSLNSIQLYILDNDAKMSGLYLSKFAKLIRMSLEISQHNKISLSKEIEVNSLYLDMEKLRFKDRFTYEFEYLLDNNPARLHIPPFLIQPLLENAIWHGLMTKEGIGKIIISIKDIGDQVVITITDNGIGRKAAREIKARNNKSHKPVGISVSRRRLILLSQQFNQIFSLRYKDLYDDNGTARGTEVTLSIPYDEIKYQPGSNY